MQRLIIRRLIAYAPTIILVSMLIYSLLLLIPGQDPVNIMLGDSGDPELIELFRKELGLDRPIHVQYADWVWGVAHGDWGRSIRTRELISVELKRRFAITLELAIGSLIVAAIIAIPIGVYSAARPHTIGDNAGTIFAIAGVALPNFWFAILMIYLFAVILGWLPSQGYVALFESPVENFQRMLMPVTVNAFSASASTMRQTRSAMLEVLQQDYIRTAHAKGLKEREVLTRHALKNGLIPVITVFGLTTAQALGGSAIIETIFRLPGLGQLAVSSATNFDIPAVQGVLLLFGSFVIAANFMVDIAYGFLDPRIRYS